jgi:4-amino-4-deoxy-L-arabinose transferase-like glycosyltransferase
VIRLFEQKPERVLRYVLYLQLALWAAIPAFTYANAPLDVVENIGWGREWQLGYYKHPPLQAWLTYAVWQGSGGHVWPIYVLSQACVVLTQLGLFALARDIGGARRGLWAVLLFSVSYYATFPTPEFNANVLQMPIWIWSAFVLRRAILRGGPGWWVALGGLLALGLYAKYSIAVLVGALAVALFTQPKGRAALGSPWPWAGAALAAALTAPQLIWLQSVDFLPLTFTAEKNAVPSLLRRLIDIADFLGGQFLDEVAAIVVLALAGARWRPPEADTDGAFDDRRFVAVLALAPLALTVLASLLSKLGLRDMWGAAMAPFLSLAMVVFLEPAARGRRLTAALAAWAAIFLLAPVGAGVAATLASQRDKPPKIAFPGASIARSLDEVWEQVTATPLDIVAGKTWEANAVAAYSRDRPHVFVDGSWRYNPWITRERVAQRGVLVVWTGSDEPPAKLQTLGPFQARGQVLARYRRGGKLAAVKWAIRAPGLPAPAGTP